MRRATSCLVAALLVLAAGPPALAAEQPGRLEPPAPGTSPLDARTGGGPRGETGAAPGRAAYMLELEEQAAVAPLVEGKRVTAAGAKARRGRVRTATRGVENALRARGRSPLYSVGTLYAGVAVEAEEHDVAELAALPGVKAVHRLQPMERRDSSAVPLVGAPTAWASGALGTGEGMTIGVIDTGVDYLHTHFGGPGTPAAYTANDTRTVEAGGGFPNAKVVGGWDFAGDAYDPGAGVPPSPDPDPADCAASGGGGHGTHVAGTAAGYGVRADGTTYPGPYDASAPLDELRIGPGVAPKASIYSLRVFGCRGGTHLTLLALERAADPNQDGDTSDHLDVVNLSLGSDFGTADDPVAAAADAAAAAGMVVVASAGNAGDLYQVTSSPASADRAISVASSSDGVGWLDGFTSAVAGGAPTVRAASNSVDHRFPGGPTTAALVGSTSTGCTGFDAAEVTGKVVMVDWVPPGAATFPCGSRVRVENAALAGATGVVMVDRTDRLSTTIAGAPVLPSVLTTRSTGDALAAALAAGSSVTVTLTDAHDSAVADRSPGGVDTLSTFSSRGPQSRTGGLKPDLAAPGETILSAGAGSGSRGTSLSGTSMAAPVVAGTMALLRAAHPTWTVEQLKALVMNTAGTDVTTATGTPYGPARAGTGRVDVARALSSEVVAYDAARPGAVGVSFGAVAALGEHSVERTVTVVNRGSAPAAYAVGYTARTTVPGAAWSFPDGDTVSVPAGGTTTFRVRLTATAGELRHVADPTLTGTASGRARPTFAEASGLITLTPASGTALRLPVHASVRPASAMTTTQPEIDLGAPTTTVQLTGTGVDSGGTSVRDITSTVTALELAHTSPRVALPALAGAHRAADLRHVGVASTDSTLYVGVHTWSPWSTPHVDAEFDVHLDVDRDGTDDFILYNSYDTAAPADDLFLSVLYDVDLGRRVWKGPLNVRDDGRTSALFDNDVLVLQAPLTALGLSASTPSRLSYRLKTWSGFSDEVVDTTPWLTYDPATPGLRLVDPASGTTQYDDLPGRSIPVTVDAAAFAADGAQGLLLLHHFNAPGTTAQVLAPLPPDTAAPELPAFGVTPTSVDVRAAAQTVTVTAHVTDASGAQAPVVGLRSPDGRSTVGSGAMTRVSGSARDGHWERSLTLARGSAVGTWSVELSPLRDTVGNVGPAGVPAGYPSTVTVVPPPEPAPTAEPTPTPTPTRSPAPRPPAPVPSPAPEATTAPAPTTPAPPAPAPEPAPEPPAPPAPAPPAPAPPGAPAPRSIDDSCPAARVPPDTFGDVADGPHRPAIACLLWWGVTTGRTATEYAPHAGVSRAAMATFVARTILSSGGQLPAAPPDAFRDDDGSVHELSINQLAAAGVVAGTGRGGYSPAAQVNRGQMARFLANAAAQRRGQPLPAGADAFSDDDGHLFEASIDAVAAVGITGGRSDGRYDPAGPVTRAQMASFLARLLDVLVEQGLAPRR